MFMDVSFVRSKPNILLHYMRVTPVVGKDNYPLSLYDVVCYELKKLSIVKTITVSRKEKKERRRRKGEGKYVCLAPPCRVRA